MIFLTMSRASKSKITISFKADKYFSSVLFSRAILARLIVFTFTEPTFNAVPPILLKYPRSSMLLFNLQQFESEVTELSINKFESFHFILCLQAQRANSSSTNLPFCLRREIELTGKVIIFFERIRLISSK